MKILTAVTVAFFSIFSGLAQARELAASYIVPPLQAGSSANTYPISQADLGSNGANETTLTFRLPEDLVGDLRPPVALVANPRTASGVLNFSRPGLNASCAGSGPRLSCLMMYDSDYFDVPAATAEAAMFLRKKFAADPATLSLKLSQSQDFLRDPEGVLVLYR